MKYNSYLFYIYIFLLTFILLSCSSSCDNKNSNNNTNGKTNNNVNNQNLNQTPNKNINTNNSNKNNIVENQNNPNNQQNVNSNQQENINVNNNSNNEPIHEKCLSPGDYNGEDAPVWLREKGYISRKFCESSGVSMIMGDNILLNIFENRCQNSNECEWPEYALNEVSDGLGNTSHITATVGRILKTRDTSSTNYYFVEVYLLDEIGNTEIASFMFGKDAYLMGPHLPTDKLIGKKLTFIERHLRLGFGAEFSAAFVKDPETGKLLFGAVAQDNMINAGSFYSDLLPPMSFSASFKDSEIQDLCDAEQYQYNVYNLGDDCSLQEYGDVIIETDKGKFVVPLRTEGNIFIGDDKYRVFSHGSLRHTENTCRPSQTTSYVRYNFFLFDNEYFTLNPEFVSRFPECDAME